MTPNQSIPHLREERPKQALAHLALLDGRMTARIRRAADEWQDAIAEDCFADMHFGFTHPHCAPCAHFAKNGN